MSGLIWERMALTLVLTFATLLATWAHRAADRRLLGGAEILDRRLFRHLHQLPRPRRSRSFLLALVLMYVAAVEFGQEVGGLFSEQYADGALEHRQGRSTCCSISGFR